jgi:hypothetical protein
LNGETATLFRLTEQVLPGTSAPITQLDVVDSGVVQNNRVDFDQPAADGYMIRLGSNTIIFRSDRLGENAFAPVQGSPQVRQLEVNLLNIERMHLSLADLQKMLPAPPIFSVVKNNPSVAGIRIDSLFLKQVSTSLEVNGTGNALSFYDPSTNAFVEGTTFDYLYRFNLGLFTGLPLFGRILNIHSEQAIVTPQVGGPVLNSISGALVNMMEPKLEQLLEQGVQRALDTSVRAQLENMRVRTATLIGIKLLTSGQKDGVEYEGFVWLREVRNGCRPRSAQALIQMVRGQRR